MYVWCSEGLSRRNLDLLQSAAQVIAGLHGPWVLAADFNFPPEVLRDSGWLSLVRGKIIAPDAPTCGRKTYDYFVVASGLGGAFAGISIVDDAGFHPHSPARLFLKGRIRKELKRALVAPRKFPACCPVGCVGDPMRFSTTIDLESECIDDLAIATFEAAETELVELFGLEGKDAALAQGRSSGPKFVMKPALGSPGSPSARCSRVTAAWDCIAAWFKILLVHWGADIGSGGHLPTFMKTKWKLCHQEWAYLGNGRNALAFREWFRKVRSDVLQDRI